MKDEDIDAINWAVYVRMYGAAFEINCTTVVPDFGRHDFVVKSDQIEVTRLITDGTISAVSSGDEHRLRVEGATYVIHFWVALIEQVYVGEGVDIETLREKIHHVDLAQEPAVLQVLEVVEV